MGFLTNIFKATVGVIITPVVVVKDVLIDGDLGLETTRDNLEEAYDNATDAVDDLFDGDVL